MSYVFFYSAPDDYAAGPVTFNTGANDRCCIRIPIVVDTIAEDLEHFTVSLYLPSAANPTVLPGAITTAVVNIIGKC